MSRHIQTADPESRKLNNLTQNGKLILTYIKEKAVALLLRDDMLISVQVIDNTDTLQVGEVYIGKIKNIVKNIDSCFVELPNDQICYLSMKDARSAYILNRKNSTLSQNPENIQLQPGDELPVQILRNAIKTKPAAVTTDIELVSECFIFKAGSPNLGISNKISPADATRIKKCFETNGFLSGKQIIQEENIPLFGVIARTKSCELEEEALAEEYIRQRECFLDLYKKAKFRTCYSCISESTSSILSVVKEFKNEYDEIITDIPEYYDILEKEEGLIPVRLYQDSFPLVKLYGLQTKLDNAFLPKVWLKSGANLVIEQTECLTTIDVNTGKNIKGKEVEDTIFQVNKEAAEEVAVQIRLRNLSGIIIVDFINMKNSDQEVELLNYLRDLTAADPVPTKVVDMTPLGLVEMTRKKVKMSLKEQFK